MLMACSAASCLQTIVYMTVHDADLLAHEDQFSRAAEVYHSTRQI